MKILLAVAVLLFPTLAFCDVPEFIRSLPTAGYSNPLIDKDGNEEIILDGKPAIRRRDGRIVTEHNEATVDRIQDLGSKPELDREVVKVVESPPQKSHAPPVFEDKPETDNFTLKWKQEVRDQLKKMSAVPMCAFRAIPEKAQELADILPIPAREKSARARFPMNLDVSEFMENSHVSGPDQTIISQPKKAEAVRPTAEQLDIMRQFGLSVPPTLRHLDGSVTAGISTTIPCGEYDNGWRQPRYTEQWNLPGVYSRNIDDCQECQRRH